MIRLLTLFATLTLDLSNPAHQVVAICTQSSFEKSTCDRTSTRSLVAAGRAQRQCSPSASACTSQPRLVAAGAFTFAAAEYTQAERSSVIVENINATLKNVRALKGLQVKLISENALFSTSSLSTFGGQGGDRLRVAKGCFSKKSPRSRLQVFACALISFLAGGVLANFPEGMLHLTM
eukprot:gnl/TRDRNA2_/TRDRNA2_35057_c0_seq1.p1 gnl/TRDRNA2_/TRDRNA2_35057_c0~~gnl/TRDRNA2_/TRDRNA2_35057_c0_seq1.p1  ORF type:complete len:178 (-),score=19.10 gnl/TRDRNA2_/TRDRNA2_35057_c0_seq1:787-1320(-)